MTNTATRLCLLAGALFTGGCREPGVTDGPGVPGAVGLAVTADPVRISGTGSIGTGPGVPGRDFREVDLDVADLTGRLFFRDWLVVRPDGTAGWIRVSPDDPATSITAFRDGSNACADPAHGVEFDGIGRDNAGGDTNPAADELLAFTVWACDGAPPWSGGTDDYFAMIVPAHDYARGDVLDAGNLVKSGGAPAPPVAATRLAFTVQPRSVTAGWYISPPVEVTARDDAGQTATGFGGTVTIAIGSNPGSGTLFGTTSVAAVSGVATFSELWIEGPGNGYRLVATASGLASATSTSFNVRRR